MTLSSPARIIATASGFQLDDWHDRSKLKPSDLGDTNAQRRQLGVLIFHGDQRVEDLAPWLGDLTAIEIVFDDAGDGRGFSLARRLGEIGYHGAIRASGGVHVDQFRQALQCGYDAVILTRDAASRMPEQHWISAARTSGLSYQSRLGLAS
jgi:uncharacterized protein (DUF934 family)